jgi:diguanylate cyclase (GGDEF)-like protein
MEMDIEQKRAAAIQELAILDTPPEERFDRLTRLAMNIFDVPAAQVTLLDNERLWFKSNLGSHLTEIPRAISFCTHTVDTADGFMLVEDASVDPVFSRNPLVIADPLVRFYAGVSLVHTNGVPLGTFCILDRKSRVLTKTQRLILKDLAATAQHKLVTMQLAMLDDLTGLNNRRGFVVEAEKLLKHAVRQQQDVSFVYLDLDGFKAINDTHGHAGGDVVLRRMSNALQTTFRATDVISRYGGDEFVICCNDLSEDAVDGLVQRLRDTLNAEADQVSFEFSVGVATTDWKGLDVGIGALLDTADKQMYARKKQKKTLRSLIFSRLLTTN